MDQETVRYILLGIGVILVILSLWWRRTSAGVWANRKGMIIQVSNSGIANTGDVKGDICQGGQGETLPHPKPNPWIRGLELAGAVSGILGLLLALWPFLRS